jgi:hypothetical protein
LPPRKPVGLSVKPRPEGYLKLTWPRPPGESIHHYFVYRGIRRYFVADDTSLLDKIEGNSFLDADVTGSTYYFYRIIAVDTLGNTSPPSDPEEGKTPVDNILKQVTAFCLIAIAFLIFFYFVYEWQILDIHSFVLNLDGNPTYTNDKLTAIINNNDPRTLTIHELDGSPVSDVDAINLADNSGSEAIPFSAELANTPNPGFPGVSAIAITINSNDIKRGIFEGSIVVQANQISSLPIRLATEPLIIQAIIISGIGILVSVILWEFIKYFKKNNDEQARRGLVTNVRKAQRNAYLNRSYYQQLRTEREKLEVDLGDLRRDMSNIQNVFIRSHIQSQIHSLQGEIGRIDKLAENTMILESLNKVFAEVNSEAATRKSQLIENYKSRSLRPRSLWLKIIFTEFGSAILGISIGIFGLLSNDFVLGLRTIGPFEVTVLFGLGLGIGSLKEFVDK